ncbi:MAG: MraY family glycosyltransferase, partial [Bdellovibrionota bacterium]
MQATMANSWSTALIAFGTAGLLSYLFARFHSLHSIGSRSDKRRHNERPIPLIGGAAVAIGFIFGCFSLTMHGFEVNGNRIYFVFAAMSISLLTGLIDDAVELRARWKLLGQNLVALLLLLAVNGLETPPDRLLGQDSFAAFALKWFWCLGILNSINLIDGLDELASGVTMIVLSFLTLATVAGSPFHGPLLFAGLPALAGFYVLNRHPAKIYLGESGAQLAGIMLFLGSMSFHSHTSAAVDISALFFALGVPILDTLLAIIRRVKRKTGLMVADREHLHHRLGRLGLSHPNISRFLHALTIYLCGVAYAFLQCSTFSPFALALALTGLGINLFLLSLAERKLYFYLANFASHMIQMLDHKGKDTLALATNQRKFDRDGNPYVVFRLSLNHCVGNLLERSPGRIQTFYGKLGEAIRGMPEYRE